MTHNLPSKGDLQNIRAILFDMDGVIIDSKEQVESFWFEKLKKYGVEIDEEYLETRVHGRPARMIIDELFSELSKEEREKLDQECSEYDASQTDFNVVPGVEQLLIELSKSDLPFGLVTSALPPKVEIMLSSLSVQSPFQAIVTADLVKNGKPNPECYTLGAQKLGIPINQVLVFEDSVSGVEAAASAGATVIGVNTPAIAPLLLDAGAIQTISNFTYTKINNNYLTFISNETGERFSFQLMI